MIDQFRAIIRGYQLNPGGETCLEHLDLGLDSIDRRQRILPGAHDDDAARDFAFAVEFGDPAAHLRPQLHARHIAQAHCDTGVGGHQRNRAEVIQGFQIARSSHHVFGFAQLQQRAPGFLVRPLYRLCNFSLRDVEGAHAVRLKHNLILAHHAANRCDLRHVGHCLEFVFKEPVLQRA